MIYVSASYDLLFGFLYCIAVAFFIAQLYSELLLGPCHVICAFNILCSSRSLIIIGLAHDCFYKYVLLVVITV